MTIMKTVIGVGILGLPSVVYKLGWVTSIIVFTIATILNQYSCLLLLKIKNLSHKSNYSTIGFFITNGKGIVALLYFIFIFNNFGICIAELTIFRDIIRDVAQKVGRANLDTWYVQSWFTVGIILGIILIPFAIVKKI
jgi:amino acid permease